MRFYITMSFMVLLTVFMFILLIKSAKNEPFLPEKKKDKDKK